MATSTIRISMSGQATTAMSGTSHTASTANTWERVGSFTLTRDTLVYATSTYTVRCTGLGFGGTTITNTPGNGYIEGDNQIWRSPVFLLPAGTYYLWIKSNSTASANTYTVWKLN